MTKIFLALSLALNFIITAWLIKGSPIQEQYFQVERIIDGDTFILNTKQQIRLQNLNAPELNLCGGLEAKSKLESLLSGQSVSLIGDITDKFGRRIALVYQGDILINEQMLHSGWGRFTSTYSDQNDRLKIAATHARDNNLGVYSSLCLQQTNPTDPKCSIKGNVREGKKTYFFSGCGNYSNVILELDQGDQWFCSEAEAQSAGFTKAINCYTKKFSDTK
ncbi:thermonuclease family protein [Patescibacteria group bacterium]|nr:thermonuclease family protein [Patescibacteria group bacterium]MCG2702151.1 thermonuclease family protein [Candidatus Parcubacteria bacterium]MBU4210143.1 thermonuclease family protein [Patescibacteria group bacterium]MBU4264800.1 thermonuclease family protein [Patescibacteria group bacterium]MBU4390138.1 thermonuclease family protein [Patescibacteria group bacterium]